MTRHVMPRSILLGAVRAEASPAELIQTLSTSLAGFQGEMKSKFDGLEKIVAAVRTEHDALKGKADAIDADRIGKMDAAVNEVRDSVKSAGDTIKAIKSEIDKLNAEQAALKVTGGAKASKDPRVASPFAAEYAKNFETYFRKGERALQGGENALRELEVKAAMTVGSDPDGGYTVLPDIEQTIDETIKQVSPMRQLATVRQISTSEYRKLVNLHGTASGWVGETADRPQTAGANLSELRYPVMEMYAMPAASQSLLDDSFVDIGAWLASEVQLEFAQKEGSAFISGSGVNQPSGFLGAYTIVADASYAWGKIGYIATGASGAFHTGQTPPVDADCLVDTYTALLTPYRMNSAWTMNRNTMGAVRKLKDTQGRPLLEMNLGTDGLNEEVLGRPVVEMPDMPDIAANSYSIALGDWKRAYLVVDRVGIRVLRDPFTAKPHVLFYTTKRVGGGVQNFEALKLVRFAAS